MNKIRKIKFKKLNLNPKKNVLAESLKKGEFPVFRNLVW
jgi:hypothetical protein